VSISLPNPGNYPWKNLVRDSKNDTWGYPVGECTSFVCWYLNALGIAFRPNWRGQWFGNASTWAAAASAAGVGVDRTPAIASVLNIPPLAAFEDPDGHVAMVVGIASNGTVTVQDYNWGYGYHQHTFSAAQVAETHILHFERLLAPSPTPKPTPTPAPSTPASVPEVVSLSALVLLVGGAVAAGSVLARQHREHPQSVYRGSGVR